MQLNTVEHDTIATNTTMVERSTNDTLLLHSYSLSKGRGQCPYFKKEGKEEEADLFVYGGTCAIQANA